MAETVRLPSFRIACLRGFFGGVLWRPFEGRNEVASLALLRTRRSVLKGVTGTAGALVAGSWVLGAPAQAPQPMPSPNAPNQNVPGGLNGSELNRPDKLPPSTMNQLQISADVQQLYKLAVELRDEMEHTNLKLTFPLDFVKKAQQIEKLAKQIKDRAKG